MILSTQSLDVVPSGSGGRPVAPKAMPARVRLLPASVRRAMPGILAAIAACAGTMPASAQPYPSKPIRFFAAFPAGGASDIVARGLGQRMSELLGQPVIVDNRSGAGGQIGADAVAKAPPDGYSLLLGASFLVIAPSLYRKLPYEALRDFAPVSLVATNQFVLVVHPSVPVRSLKDLLALARARPGQLNYASSGIGAPPHLSTELLRSMTGIDATHVPYKGGVPALTDLLGGQVDFYITGIAGVMPYVKSGRLRPVAVTSSKRSAQLRDVPTMAESGLAGYDITTWFGVLTTGGTPRDTVRRLNDTVRAIVAEPAMRGFIEAQGIEPLTSSPEEYAAFLRSETEKFAKIVKAAGLQPQ